MSALPGMGMNETDVIILLLLIVVVGAFTAYEEAGLEPGFRTIHTISYYAARHPWLKWLIVALFVAGGVAGGIWFGFFHLRNGIPK
ncbi:MAG: hypothetical protein ACREQ5_34020 [Candidatus Dormibacteria bacterium]